jgi:hypothetical protein
MEEFDEITVGRRKIGRIVRATLVADLLQQLNHQLS